MSDTHESSDPGQGVANSDRRQLMMRGALLAALPLAAFGARPAKAAAAQAAAGAPETARNPFIEARPT